MFIFKHNKQTAYLTQASQLSIVTLLDNKNNNNNHNNNNNNNKQ